MWTFQSKDYCLYSRRAEHVLGYIFLPHSWRQEVFVPCRPFVFFRLDDDLLSLVEVRRRSYWVFCPIIYYWSIIGRCTGNTYLALPLSFLKLIIICHLKKVYYRCTFCTFYQLTFRLTTVDNIFNTLFLIHIDVRYVWMIMMSPKLSSSNYINHKKRKIKFVLFN